MIKNDNLALLVCNILYFLKFLEEELTMARFFKKVLKKVAQPPGTLIHIGEKKTEITSITELAYDKDNVYEKKIANLDEYSIKKGFKGVMWINVNGIHDTSIIEKLGNLFNIHSLVLEDILNTFQRPKVEDFDDYMFLVLKMLRYDKEKKEIFSEQVSFIVGPEVVITFQEIEGDVFQPVRERIQKGKGKIRRMNADYLLYTLMDALVDNYFLIMEAIGEDIEDIEAQLLKNAIPETLHQVQKLRKELIYLRKGVWPLREILNTLLRGESSLIKKSTLIYLRDVYDHTIQVIETTETFRDLVSGLQDLYLSSVSNRMNEIMKVLTIIATIFIPLTFIAGIYGMNFDFMPELKWKFGYFIIWGIMCILAIGMIIYFKRKKWL
jgi:magnesium transporter